MAPPRVVLVELRKMASLLPAGSTGDVLLARNCLTASQVKQSWENHLVIVRCTRSRGNLLLSSRPYSLPSTNTLDKLRPGPWTGSDAQTRAWAGSTAPWAP